MELSQLKKCAVKVPLGQILVNKKWAGSSVSKELETSQCRVFFSDGLGFVDFFPSDSLAVLYITEAEILSPKTFTERVKLLVMNFNRRGAIIVDICQSSGYQELQDLACIDHELTVYPVANQNEIPCLLKAFMQATTKQLSNPFKVLQSSDEDLGKHQLSLLRQIPGIGDKTALKLLKSHGHILSISNMLEERLACLIGKADAQKVYQYFKSEVTLY